LISDFDFIDSNHGWAVGGNMVKAGGIIYKTINGGIDWQQIEINCGNLTQVKFLTTMIGWAIGYNGTILHTQDGGISWELQTSGTTEGLLDLHFTDESNGWIVGGERIILHTANGGQSWEVQSIAEEGSLKSVFFIDPDHGWAVGEWEIIPNNTYDIIYTSDGGQNWHQSYVTSDFQLNDIYFTDLMNGWAVGHSGTIIYTNDGGETWEEQVSESVNNINSIQFIDSQEGWAVGGYGAIMHTNNGGIPNNCLPEGITFTTQAQIDSFQILYPNCTEIEGDVTIDGYEILNLNGLSVLTTIGGLSIGHTHLKSLEGLNNVTSIGGQLFIKYNDSLQSISALSNVNTIDGYFNVVSNINLTTLSGLENIEANSMTSLYIYDNTLLASCDVQSICDHLAAPSGIVSIFNNAPGCNSQQEVEEACASSISEIGALIGLAISPNPFTTSTTVEYELKQPSTVQLSIYNQLGQLVYQTQENQQQGKQQLLWNADRYADGIYYYRLQVGDATSNGKMVKVR